MEKTLNVTTFNILHNPERKEERVEVLFQEIKEHGSDVVLLQEVLEETFPLIEEKARQEGWFVSEGARVTHSAKRSGNVTLSRTPIQSEYSLPSYLECSRQQIETLVTHLENNVTIINAHLVWGSTHELQRLDVAYTINQYAECLKEEEPDRLIILGGDLNSILTSTVSQYFNGDLVYKDSSTFWTSAWDMAEEVFPTARKDGGWAEITATSVGITRPEQMPDRTIDYIFTYGWNFGKKHCPLDVKKFGESNLSNGYGLSDHYGLTTKVSL